MVYGERHLSTLHIAEMTGICDWSLILEAVKPQAYYSRSRSVGHEYLSQVIHTCKWLAYLTDVPNRCPGPNGMVTEPGGIQIHPNSAGTAARNGI